MKKIIYVTTIISMAIIISISVNFTMKSQYSSLSLKNIEALASGETGILANKCCPIWNISYTVGGPWPTVTCSTGGTYQCESCKCPY